MKKNYSLLAPRLVWTALSAVTLTLAFAAAAPAQTGAGAPPVGDEPALTAKPAASTPPAPAQGTAAKAPRQLKLGKVNVGGSLRLRAEGYGWFETPGFQDEYAFGAAQLRFSLGQQREGWDWLVEGQFTGLLNLPERAVAPAPRGFQPSGALARVKAWVRAGYFRSTGDGDPTDARHETFFQVLPTPRVYARFPFYNLMNSEDAFAQVSLKPHARLTLRADVHALRLSNPDDPWYAGGGAFQEATFGYQGRPSGGRKSLGTLLDLSADVSLTPTTTLTLYGAGVRGGGVASNAYPEGGANPTARLLYAELTKRF